MVAGDDIIIITYDDMVDKIIDAIKCIVGANKDREGQYGLGQILKFVEVGTDRFVFLSKHFFYNPELNILEL